MSYQRGSTTPIPLPFRDSNADPVVVALPGDVSVQIGQGTTAAIAGAGTVTVSGGRAYYTPTAGETNATMVRIIATLSGAKTLDFGIPTEPETVDVGAIAGQTVSATGAVNADLIANLDAAVSSRNATTPPTSAAIATQVRTELAIELGRIDENVSDPKTLTAATLSALFDDSDASQQLTDFFAGLIERFDEATDTPVATIAAAMVAALTTNANFIELLADAEAARAQAVANGTAIGSLPAPLDSAATQSAAAAALTAYDPPTRSEATADKQEILDRGNAAWTTGSGGSGGNAIDYTSILELIRGKGYEPPVAISQQEKALSFVSTIDLSNVLTTGDVPAKVGDTITKLISGSTTWNAVGTPRLVDVPGRTLPGIELDGASGFVAETSPLSGDNANGGVFVCGFTRKGDPDSTQMVLGGTSTASTTTNKLLFVTRQATNARNTGLVGLQTATSLRTFQGSDIAGRQNAKSRVIWEAGGFGDDYVLKTQSGTHAVSGT
ncbi:MAG: hypothetical protein AAF745_11170, partial [Planctomycetota bacterium]